MNQSKLQTYKMKKKIEELALLKGYLPYEPPLFESYDNFNSINCEIKKEQLIPIHYGQELQVLRPEITTTIVNSILPTLDSDVPLKLFYQSTVYRLIEGDLKGINQFGIEVLGVEEPIDEKEILQLALNYLEDVPFMLEVGTTRFLDKLIKLTGLDEEKARTFRKLVEIKSKEELIKFGKLHDLPASVRALLPNLFSLRGSHQEVLKMLQAFNVENELLETVANLNYLEDFSKNVIFDLSMTNPLTYYDGILFKGYYRQVPQAVLSGGRYDKNAIGFVIDVDNWIAAQKKEGSRWNT